MTNEEVQEEIESLDRLAGQYSGANGQVTREEFIEQGAARLIVSLMLVHNAIDDEEWEAAVTGLLPISQWSQSLAAACLGKMSREQVIDMMRRREEVTQGRPLKVVSDLGDEFGVVLGPDDVAVPDALPDDFEL